MHVDDKEEEDDGKIVTTAWMERWQIQKIPFRLKFYCFLFTVDSFYLFSIPFHLLPLSISHCVVLVFRLFSFDFDFDTPISRSVAWENRILLGLNQKK